VKKYYIYNEDSTYLPKRQFEDLISADKSLEYSAAEHFESANPISGEEEISRQMDLKYIEKWIETLRITQHSSDRRISQLEQQVRVLEKIFKDIKVEKKIIEEIKALEKRIGDEKDFESGDPFNPANSVLPEMTKEEYNEFFREE